jgi:hypothetical protein
MPRALQTIAGFATNGGAATTVATPAPGDSFAVTSFTGSGTAMLEQVNASGASTDWVRVRSPRMHDAQQAVRLWTGANGGHNMLPWGTNQPLYSSDVPIVEIDTTAAASGGVLLTYGYTDLPGVQPSLDVWSNIEPRIQQILGAEVSLAGGAIGAWSAGVAINAAYDVFEANQSYALLGYRCSVACLGIKITGTDTGNLGIGGPGAVDGLQTQNYFAEASVKTGRPYIPIIQANNKASTLVANVDSAANTATIVNLIFALLSS